jgi:protein-disulfide isomerase
MCPYCEKFNTAVLSQEDKFKKDYLDSNKVYFELRLGDFLDETHSVNSHRANLSGYCAAKQNKFWPYYNALQTKLDQEFYSKNIGVKGGSEMPKQPDSLYLDTASAVGLDADAMDKCLDDSAVETELNQNSKKGQAIIRSGVPYFVFGQYQSSGFGGDYTTVQQMFKAGGVK